MPIKYFSMFSGIGGFEYGMEQSKYEFENVGFSEVDKFAESIYTRHFPRHRNFGDATKINTEELEDFSLLVGGFPCQAFSIAGKRKGFNDTRGTLFFEIARILKDKRPKYFLLENVKGLLSHERGETIQTIFRVCDELGYDVSWQIYNSKDYGVPQNRERIFIKGYFRRECGSEVLSQTRTSREVNEVNIRKLNDKAQAQSVYDSDGLACTLSASGGGQGGKTGLYRINKIGNFNGHQSGDVYDIEGISPSLCATGDGGRTGWYDVSDDTPRINKIGNISPSGHGGGNVYSDEGLSPTLLSRDYKDPIKINTSKYSIRRLTPLECERLQGFSDNWTEYGKDGEKISDTQRYKCVGNAVTTTVITAIIEEMFSHEEHKE